MTKIKIKIPAGMDFAELRLARDPETGGVLFDWEPVERLCKINNLDIEVFRLAPEDNVAGLIVAWYAEHRAHGGEPDATAEELLVEVILEDERGGGISHPPGRG